ncbi:arabinogalactan peptide 22-like [Carica papaya]|uniref:arabinogalactan peptide 22-like n=1 Tax=Carica papaya TaxID=3649 RepID=UPI000B8CDAAD|nr:arabinogalactan peptide 22-like [Carica papaya]
MAVSRVCLGLVTLLIILIFAIALPSVQAQSSSPAPAPTSDGATIDQGIAYVLMLVALLLTYLIH